MNIQRLAILLLAITATSQVALAQQAQQPPRQQKKPANEIRVFYLRYVSCQDAAEVALQILDSAPDSLKIAPEARTNSLIVSGTPETLKALEQVLESLDTAVATKAEDRRTLRKYRVPGDAQLVQRVLQTMLSGSDARIEKNEDSLIVYGNNNTHSQVGAILDQLLAKQNAQTTESYYIHLVWIVGGGPKAEDWKLNAIPGPLKELVEKKLAPRLGLESPGMVGQVLIRATLNGDETKVNASGTGALSDVDKFEIICDATLEKMDGGVKLNFDLNTAIRGAAPVQLPGRGGPARQRSTANNLNTTISLKLDHPVCLGTTPTNGVDSVFVIQVSRDL